MIVIDDNIVRIFGKAMGFHGSTLEAFVADYGMTITEILTHSAIEHINELADPDDVNKLQKIAEDIEEERVSDLTELGTFIGAKLTEYPEINKIVEQEISDFNEGNLSDFLAVAPEEYIRELVEYLDKTQGKNNTISKAIEEFKSKN